MQLQLVMTLERWGRILIPMPTMQTDLGIRGRQLMRFLSHQGLKHQPELVRHHQTIALILIFAQELKSQHSTVWMPLWATLKSFDSS